MPDILTSYGLCTVDGACNNLKTGLANAKVGAADQIMPRLASPVFRAAEPITPAFPVGAPGPTTYKTATSASVGDSQPRVISNLIVDQTSANPPSIAPAGFPVRAQRAAKGVIACKTVPGSDPVIDVVPATPAGCVAAHQTLEMANVTTDVGLSPPYHSVFTYFGQFFDHGVDQTVKGGAAVFVPLRADDPLVAGPDHIFGNADDLKPSLLFMVLTRAQNQPGPDKILGTADDICDTVNTNTDSPWVDNSQTYASHASHQVFLRESSVNRANHLMSTRALLWRTAGRRDLRQLARRDHRHVVAALGVVVRSRLAGRS